MNYHNVARTCIKIAVGISTSAVVSQAVKNQVNPTTKLQQAEVIVASFVIGSLVADHCEKYAVQMYNNTCEGFKKAFNQTEA